MNDRKSHDSSCTGQLPAQQAMRQLSKTDSEREEPVGPDVGRGHLRPGNPMRFTGVTPA
jgi:hypothetical protein